VSIDVRVEDELRIDVIDNGRGIPDRIAESGLANLRHRAGQAGGVFTVGSAAGGGTALHWAAPLS
jgi:two-component system sensor histidine kinase DevS